MKGPRSPEAPRRLPESWRVNLKPLIGSPIFSHILPIQTRGHFQKSQNWSFSSEARCTVTRITLFQFADTTSMSVPQSKDFPGARESASSPALNKDQRSHGFRPKNIRIISRPTSPRQSPPPKLASCRGSSRPHPRVTAMSVYRVGSVGIPRRASRATGLGCVGIPPLTQSVYRPHPSR